MVSHDTMSLPYLPLPLDLSNHCSLSEGNAGRRLWRGGEFFPCSSVLNTTPPPWLPSPAGAHGLLTRPMCSPFRDSTGKRSFSEVASNSRRRLVEAEEGAVSGEGTPRRENLLYAALEKSQIHPEALLWKTFWKNRKDKESEEGETQYEPARMGGGNGKRLGAQLNP